MRGLYPGMERITNHMFINEHGEHITRCFDRHGMYEIPTQPEAIRPPMGCMLWSVENEGTSFSDRERGKDGVYVNTKDRF